MIVLLLVSFLAPSSAAGPLLVAHVIHRLSLTSFINRGIDTIAENHQSGAVSVPKARLPASWKHPRASMDAPLPLPPTPATAGATVPAPPTPAAPSATAAANSAIAALLSLSDAMAPPGEGAAKAPPPKKEKKAPSKKRRIPQSAGRGSGSSSGSRSSSSSSRSSSSSSSAESEAAIKRRIGGQKKPCPRADCTTSPNCSHCRCDLAENCGAACLHTPPCEHCFSGALFVDPARWQRLPDGGRTLTPPERHHCAHVCEDHWEWMKMKPRVKAGRRTWQNKTRPYCNDPSCPAGTCSGVRETSGRFVNRASCKMCYNARERAQRTPGLQGPGRLYNPANA